MDKNFNTYIEESIKDHWDSLALMDYQGQQLYYKDAAKTIARLHILFEQCGIEKGDKVSIAGRNSAHWGISFLATLTYGAVAVPVLHEFKPENMYNIIKHSESKILLVGDVVWSGLDRNEIADVDTIVLINDFSFLHSKNIPINEIEEKIDKAFAEKYKGEVTKDDVKYHKDTDDELVLINYTSGTTGFSKGVMLQYKSLIANLEFARKTLPQLQGSGIVLMLPMAHMFGLMFEFIFPLVSGCSIQFLTRTPTPKIILDAYAVVKPKLIISVPLIIEKVFKNKIKPVISKPSMKILMKLPIIKQIIYKKILKQVSESFGGNVLTAAIGGAALNTEAEQFFKKIGFQYSIGYGMTECGPLISYVEWESMKLYSCGKAIPTMQVKIDNPNPKTGIGEIIVKGKNVFAGYYKNPEATNAAFDEDGWFHTGDLGIIDNDGYVFIKGRCKNMILTASGQNVYPEEIEDQLNNLPYINESILIENNGKLIALIYPDYERAAREKMSNEQLEKILENEKNELNKHLPNFSQIAQIKIRSEEFEKTPKKSIKRFMYQN